jgi:hypothetical protein
MTDAETTTDADLLELVSRTTPIHEGGHVAMAWLLGGDAAIGGPVTCVETAWTLGSAEVWLEKPAEKYWHEALSLVTYGLPIANQLRGWAEDMVHIFQAGDIAIVRAESRGLFKLPPAGTHFPKRPAQARLIAKARARGESKPDSDTKSAKSLLGYLSAGTEAAEHWRDWLLDRTWTLARHPLFDAIVDAIAEALRIHQTLTREEVLAIIHAITDRPPAEPRPAAGTSGYYA